MLIIKRRDVILLLLVFVIMFLGMIFVVSLTIPDYRKVEDIAKTHQTIYQFFESDIPVAHLHYVDKKPTQYIWWELPIDFTGLPSGPAVFIFDEKGNVCDYSRDIGDDSKFRKKWDNDVNRDQNLPLFDLKKKFGYPIPTDNQLDDDNETAIHLPNESGSQ